MKNDSGINGDFPDIVGTDEEMEQEGSDSYVSSSKKEFLSIDLTEYLFASFVIVLCLFIFC